METFAGWLPEFADLPSIFAFLIDATIKGTVILTIALLILRLRKGVTSATAFSVLITALALCLFIPLLTMLFSQSESISFTPIEVVQSLGLSSVKLASEADTSEVQLVFPLWATALILVWILGNLLFLVRLLVGQFYTISFRRDASVVNDSRLNAILDKCKEEVGVVSQVCLVESSNIKVPLTFGYIQPTIALPYDITDLSQHIISDSEIRRIFIHELGHIKRRDNITGLFSQIVLLLFWYNPLIWFTIRMSFLQRERICDDYVLKAGADSLDYAEQLLKYSRKIRTRAFCCPIGIGIVRRPPICDRIRRLSSLGNRSIDAVALTPSSMRRIMVYALLVLLSLAPVHLPVADNIELPEMISAKDPEYPEGSSLSEVARDVWVKVLINRNGFVISSELQKTSGDDILDASALNVAGDYKFLPQRLNGKAVPVWITFRIKFPANAD